MLPANPSPPPVHCPRGGSSLPSHQARPGDPCPQERLDDIEEVLPCILDAALSHRLFHSCVADTTNAAAEKHTDSNSPDPTKTPSRILVQGPRQSGRTSIAMDLAVSVASSAPCRCGCGTQDTCRCVAVTILVPSAPRETSIFPLPCEPYEATRREAMEFQDRIRQLEQNYFLMDDGEDEKQGLSSLWNKHTLRRIQVVHLASMRDCLQFLLSIQGKVAHEQPLGAIIVDNLDILADMTNIFPGQQGPSRDSASHLLRATQLLAIFMDTAETFGRLHQCSPPILMATMESKGSLPNDSFLASFFTSTVSIRAHQAARVSWQRNFTTGGGDDEESIASSWIAEVKPTRNDNGLHVHSLHYMITSKFDEQYRILWKNQ